MEILVCGMTENQGGIEVYLKQLVENINQEKIKFSFVKEKRDIAFENVLIAKDCAIYEVTWRRKNPIRHIKELRQLLLEHSEIDLLYVNAMSSACLPSVIAGKLAKKKVLVHSRNNATKNMPVHFLLRPALNLLTDYRFACSELAAGFMFGRRKCEIISNPIDMQKFTYDINVRNELRAKYFPNEKPYVIGFVGNLTYQKNPLLLVDIFATYEKKHPGARLMIVGDGEMREEVELAIKAHSLEGKVLLLGKQKETYKFYQAFDLFLLPSRYEGFGNVLIEAQAAGLPCVCSKKVISENTRISNRISYVFIKDRLVIWREQIEKYMLLERSSLKGNGNEKKYELKNATAHIEEVLLNLI